LARRRVEALFPLSISELTAEKDHLRAEFAVLQRRLERKAEEAQAVKHQSMEELGRRAVRIEALETLLAERDQGISGLQADLSDTRSRLAGTTEELSLTQTTLVGIRETLNALETAHRATLDELAATRSELDRTKSALTDTKAELTFNLDKLARQESAYADLDGRHTAAMSDLDAKRITISDIETRLMTQTARGDDFERALGERRTELSEERQRLADLARDLASEQERGLLLDQHIRELEAERNKKAAEAAGLAARIDTLMEEARTAQAILEERTSAAQALETALVATNARIAALQDEGGRTGQSHASDLRSLSEKYELLKAEKAAAEGALMASREERARLEKALQALRKGTPESDLIQAENAELRQRILEVADLVVQDAKSKPTRSGRRRSAAT
jgi:chromosome segregation ATPase